MRTTLTSQPQKFDGSWDRQTTSLAQRSSSSRQPPTQPPCHHRPNPTHRLNETKRGAVRLPRDAQTRRNVYHCPRHVCVPGGSWFLAPARDPFPPALHCALLLLDYRSFHSLPTADHWSKKAGAVPAGRSLLFFLVAMPTATRKSRSHNLAVTASSVPSSDSSRISRALWLHGPSTCACLPCLVKSFLPLHAQFSSNTAAVHCSAGAVTAAPLSNPPPPPPPHNSQTSEPVSEGAEESSSVVSHHRPMQPGAGVVSFAHGDTPTGGCCKVSQLDHAGMHD